MWPPNAASTVSGSSTGSEATALATSTWRNVRVPDWLSMKTVGPFWKMSTSAESVETPRSSCLICGLSRPISRRCEFETQTLPS